MHKKNTNIMIKQKNEKYCRPVGGLAKLFF